MNETLKAWMNPTLIKEMETGVLNAPQDLLGMHMYEGIQLFTVRRPGAEKVWITNVKGTKAFEMEELDRELGLFGLEIKAKSKQLKNYRVRIQYSPNDVIDIADPYHFDPVTSEFDCYIFGEGKNYKIFDRMGAHVETIDRVRGTRFTVWAPDARSISVVGSFNMWDGRLHTMRLLGPTGVYELFIPGVEEGSVYKYQITTRSGDLLYKTDPYGNFAELRPGNASIVTSLEGYEWNDDEYMKAHEKRTQETRERSPMNIYEAHLGSWKKKIEDDDNGFFSYRELATMLGDYLVEMGYTHLELMGIAEYPFDGSWGYQVGCYYAPTSRYGTPKDFMYFVDEMHKRGIEVILDWVPAHFPKDAHCLGNFDGCALYEHPDRRRGEHPDWGTYIFDYGRKEVQNFLVANALFWVEKFHVDGLRVDAVASMLYLDYGKRDGDWLPNKDGGNEHYEAVEFLQHLNRVMKELHPGSYIIAEESTAWPNVTGPIENNGLGFSFKWNMGWMNDFLEYMKLDPYFKQFHHDQLCFSLTYHLSERYILVLSHDEVVHGKCSLLGKMPGLTGDKYAALKAALGFMYGHPGKKLLFMGQEFAQEREWSEMRSLDWYLLDEAPHRGIHEFVKDFNQLYLENDALYYNDSDVMGFEWMDCRRPETSTVAFVRRGSTAEKQLLFLLNFTPVAHEKYQVKVPCRGRYTEILNSDDPKYGGQGRMNPKPVTARKKTNTTDKSRRKADTADSKNGTEYEITCYLPPLSVVVLQYDYKE